MFGKRLLDRLNTGHWAGSPELRDTVKDFNASNLGFVGLGVMGEGMCSNLTRKCGLPVWGSDVDPKPIERLREVGTQTAGSTPELAEHCEIVFLSLPNGKIVENVVFGEGGLMSKTGALRIIVDMSTISPIQTRDLARRCAEQGVTFVDAPVARARQAARDGTLSIMVGADQATFDLLKPYLSCMGTDVNLCGGTGAGQIVKIMNNMVLFMNVSALAEAIGIARRTGVDAENLLSVLSTGSADSFALRVVGQRAMVPRDFPTSAFPTDYALKDINLALEMAQAAGIDASSAELTAELLRKTSEAGFGEQYYAAMLNIVDPLCEPN